ncbi:MAG: hypothetical protein HUU20_25840 [Pirellulales bacterium]|nr:hypothetical protein [Pirellulales bacterium]
MAGKRSKTARPLVALEVTRSQLHLVAVDRNQPGGPARLRSRSITWRSESLSLAGEAGQREFASALTKLAEEEKLRGTGVRLALSRYYCTTRVVSGARDHVHRELGELRARSSLYLTLGQGRKALAETVQPLDARHDHGLLAVASRKTIEILLAGAAAAGLEVLSIEPTMVALSRILGHRGFDTEAPQLIGNLTADGLELGVSFGGRLFLDYRPAGRQDRDAADLVCGHLNRLRRYCQRCCVQLGQPMGAEALSRIYLTGRAESVAAACDAFRKDGKLIPEPLDPASLEPGWQSESQLIDSEVCPALGSCLAAASEEESCPTPNFLEQIRAERREPLLPALLRSSWPVAAALLVAALLVGLNGVEKIRLRTVVQEIEALGATYDQVAEYRRQIAVSEKRVRCLQAIENEIVAPHWGEVISTVAGCLPESVWLNRLEAAAPGRVMFSGTSYGDEGAYESVRWLSAVPGFVAVQLEGMQPQSLPTGPASRFDVRFELSGKSPHAEKTENGDGKPS